MKHRPIYSFLLLFFTVSFSQCVHKTQTPYSLDIPVGFPAPVIPDHNPMTKEKAELGKKLFFDPILSSDSSISCGSCHLPEIAFANHDITATGISGHTGNRNVPSLVNIAYHPYLFAEGEVPDLETQAIAPVQHEGEMGFNIRLAVQRLNRSKVYRKLFSAAFDTLASTGTLVRALACYERTLLSGNSRYDQFNYDIRSGKMDSLEIAGQELFFSDRTNCSSCHSGFNFSNYAFENIGLYTTYADVGKMRATEKPEDEGKFKVPSLRNAALTWPYMHDGSITTLEEVVEFYNSGGKDHPNKSPLIRPLKLAEEEKKSLVAFLKCLTDENAEKRKGIFAE